MRESGVVVSVRDGRAVVRFERSAMCEKCGMCGAGREANLELPCPEGVREGETVRVALPGSRVLAASLIAYAVPLALLLAGLPVGMWIGGEPAAAACALVGAGIGFVVARVLDPWIRKTGYFSPRIIPESEGTSEG